MGSSGRRWGRSASLLVVGLALGAGLLSGCGDDTGTGGTDSAPPTSAPGPASSATTSLPPAADLVLSGDGLGAVRFGEPAAVVTPKVDAVSGPARIVSYALEPSGGLYSVLLGSPADRANVLEYKFPAVEIRCHTNGLCVILGGPSASELEFTGWTYNQPTDENGQPVATGLLRTVDGVTVGSSTLDFPGIVSRTASQCGSSFGVANQAGTIDATFDDYTDGKPQEPAPGTRLAIVSMTAGVITSPSEGCG